MRLIHVQKRNGLERKGFTLIELLVVITIIGILMALTLGVISKVYAYLDEVKVVSEVNRLAQACEQFKATFGRYPPSKIILAEGGGVLASIANGSQPTPVGYTAAQFQALGAYSAEYLSAIFPGISHSANHDWNGNLFIDVPVVPYTILEGQQCLVFFLGGIGSARIGFNTDKTNPTAQPPVSTGARLGPFFDFDQARIDATPGFPTYKDVYGTPYAYFAAKFPGLSNYPNFYFPTTLSTINDCASLTTISGSPNVHFVPYYSASLPPVVSLALATSFKFHKGDTFQIISAGKDKQFGTGGQYNQSDPEQSLFLPPAAMALPPFNTTITADMLQANYDNITNVTNGRVVPK